MRLIDADMLEQAADKAFEHIDSPLLNHLTTYDVYSLINNAPTVTIKEWKKEMPIHIKDAMLEALRPKGKWIKTTWFDEIYGYDLECPFCHEQLLLTYKNFCPNCGADMRGGT